jgi:hypothetical protein
VGTVDGPPLPLHTAGSFPTLLVERWRLVCAVNDRHGKPAKQKSRRRTSRQSGGSPRNRSKAVSSDWLPFQSAFEQLRERAGSSKDAKDDFERILHSGLPTLEQKVSFYRKKIRRVRSADFWKDSAYLWVETDVSGADYVRVHYTEYDPSLPAEPGKFFVRKRDFERELERLYPTILYPTAVAPPLATASPPRAVKGPVPGEIDRFADADRALFPEIKRLMLSQRLTCTEAVRQIPEGKLAGRGTSDSRIRRVSARFRREKL